MAGRIFKTTGAVLALALGGCVVATAASAQDGRGWNERRGDDRVGRGEQPRPERPVAERPVQSSGGPVRTAPAWNGPAWNGSAPNGSTPNGAGWNGAGGARPGWNRPSTAQSAPAVPPAPPMARPEARPDQPRYQQSAPDWSRNRSYADGWRNRSYGGDRPATVDNRAVPQQGWDGRRWNGQGNDARRDNDWRRPERGWNDHRESWSAGRVGPWNRDWRRDDRFDWRGWRSDHRDAYRLGRYTPPYRSYAYRRLGIGFFLDGGFFGANYWINDPGMYRLPPAYGPYRWVRYYDDALLVDTYSGEVVDVIYDFFW